MTETVFDEAVHVVDEKAARAMTREQALQTLAAHGDEVDKRRAELMLAGPEITMREELRLNDWRPMLPPLVMSVRLALRRMANG